MKWESERTWTAKISFLRTARITQKGKGPHEWSITERGLDFGFGDCEEMRTLSEGSANSLKQAKEAIRRLIEA